MPDPTRVIVVDDQPTIRLPLCGRERERPASGMGAPSSTAPVANWRTDWPWIAQLLPRDAAAVTPADALGSWSNQPGQMEETP